MRRAAYAERLIARALSDEMRFGRRRANPTQAPPSANATRANPSGTPLPPVFGSSAAATAWAPKVLVEVGSVAVVRVEPVEPSVVTDPTLIVVVVVDVDVVGTVVVSFATDDGLVETFVVVV
jgi:hypothetical protein